MSFDAGACLTRADGDADHVAAHAPIKPYADRPRAITPGADKALDAQDVVTERRAMRVMPHVAQTTSGRRAALAGSTPGHAGYAVSQRIEEAFGWIETVVGQETTCVWGAERVELAFAFAAATCNRMRLPKLLAKAG